MNLSIARAGWGDLRGWLGFVVKVLILCFHSAGGPIERRSSDSGGTTINRIKYLLARGLLELTSWLPLPVLYYLGGAIGAIVSFLPTRSGQTTLQNLQLCFPDLEEAELARLKKQSLQESVRTILESGKSWLWPLERAMKMVREIEGEEIFEAAQAAGKGVIVLAPHLGNFELYGQFFAERTPTTFMYQPPKIPQFDAMIRSARLRGKGQVAPTNRQGVTIVLKALRRGEVVGILPDQEPPFESGEFAPFFGVPALTMTLVTRLVERTGATVICGFAERQPRGRGYRIVIRGVEKDIYDTDVGKAVAAMNQAVEVCVRQAVPQYQWEYKRFKRRPDGGRIY